jgi:aubergine
MRAFSVVFCGQQLAKTMIIGIDTYHDTLRRGRSVAGFVASMNTTFTRYFTNWAFQEPGEELQNSLYALTTG